MVNAVGGGDIKTSIIQTFWETLFSLAVLESVMCNPPTLMSIGQPFSCAVEPNLEMG